MRLRSRRCTSALARVVAVVSALAAPLAVAVAGGVGPAAAGAEGGQFRFSSELIDAGEGQGFVRIVVERSDLPVSRATIAYRTMPGTALEGEDFEATDGILTFDVGVTSASFAVVVRNDVVSEATEQLTAVLGDRSAVAASAVVRIFDDDVRRAGSAAEKPDAGGGATAATGSSVASASARPLGPGTATAAAGPPGMPSAVRAPAASVARPVTRGRSVRPAAPRRVSVRQSPVTPFELRPALPPGGPDPGPPLAVDPFLAVAAALLLARVAAEVWFRLRTGAA